MPPERTARRQEPASCESCRRKKLRCDRNLPCHNCQSRALECVFHGHNPGVVAKANGGDELQQLRAENSAINARLQRLEAAVYNGDRNALCTDRALVQTELLEDEHSNQAGSNSQSSDPTVHDDVHNLELSSITSEALPRIGSMSRPQVCELEHLRKGILKNDHTVIFLPHHNEALLMLERYTKHADSLQHVLHVPDVRQQIDGIYSALSSPVAIPLKPGHLSLLLCILANVAGWAPDDVSDELFPARDEAIALSTFWFRCCLDIYDHVWRTTGPDLSTLQSKMLAMFLIYHREGASIKARRILSDSISDARILGLDMTDKPRSKRSTNSVEETVEIELRRRIWWHLVSTDWTMALFAGDYYGTYSVVPKHMHVRKPRNIMDEDLVTQSAEFQRPADEATSTTYYLSRIALGTICREVADILIEIETPSGFQQVAYQRIIDLDTQFVELLETMPDSLKLNIGDPAVRLAGRLSQPQRQRYFTRLTTEARRCKLHLPYLLRCSQKQEYNFSRRQCLQSARNIIWLMNMRPINREGHWETVMQHHFCCAIIILTIDLCINFPPPVSGDRKSEVRAAINSLESMQMYSASIKSFLSSLRSILLKYNVSLNEEDETLGVDFWSQKLDEVLPSNPHPVNGFDSSGTQQLSEEIDFDELWQSYLQLDSNQTSAFFAINEYGQ